MKNGIFLLLLVISLGLTGCNLTPVHQEQTTVQTGEADQPAVIRPVFTRETYPRVDGSTATIPLSEAIASELLSVSKEGASHLVDHQTTHYAYGNLVAGRADIIFVTEPSADELAIAREEGVELEVVPIVREGFVFVVNSQNPVSSLTSNQIRDIYQGRITNWKEVGGEDRPIIAYQRERNSGSQTLMEQTVMKGLELMDAPRTVISGMGELIEAVAQYENSEEALGYSVYYYASSMYNKDTLKLLAVDGIAPDNSSISSQRYPFTSAYYAVFNKSQPEDAPTRKLLQWILSQEGQQVAEKAGYVPVSGR